MALYCDHNGMTLGGFDPLSIRLMSIEEALAKHTVLRNLDYISNEMYMFWSDDNSNYLGAYLTEPSRGRVFYLDHDEPDFSPRFRSVRTFYQALLKLATHNVECEDEDDYRFWFDLETDYPKRTPDPEFDAVDIAAAQVYINQDMLGMLLVDMLDSSCWLLAVNY